MTLTKFLSLTKNLFLDSPLSIALPNCLVFLDVVTHAISFLFAVLSFFSLCFLRYA